VKILLLLLLSSFCFSAEEKNHLVAVERTTFHWSFPPHTQQIGGNGICIDRSCSIIATAYHTQMLVGRFKLGIDESRTEKVLSLANDNDTGKTDVPVRVSGMKTRSLTYNPARDISFIYTAKSIHHKSGIPYAYKSNVGETVRVVGYSKDRLVTMEAHIIGLDVPLMMGESRLDENIVLDIATPPGTSGSAVLDEAGNLLGMITLSGAIEGNRDYSATSVALPTKTIARALTRLDPVRGAAIFNGIPEEKATLPTVNSAVYEESDSFEDSSSSMLIPGQTGVPADVLNAVDKLRAHAATSSKLLVNIVTKQCLTQENRKPLCHELAMIDGEQTFREVGSSGKLGEPTHAFPKQKQGVWMQSDWSETLAGIADNAWTFRGSENGHYIFSYVSPAEEDRCYWEDYSNSVPLFGGGRGDWKGSVDCVERVETDADFNVVAVFTEMYPPAPCPTQFVQTAMYFNWIRLEDVKSALLLPVMEKVMAKVSGQRRLLYTTVSWDHYRTFRAEHKMEVVSEVRLNIICNSRSAKVSTCIPADTARPAK
jgi:hypothetical protein